MAEANGYAPTHEELSMCMEYVDMLFDKIAEDAGGYDQLQNYLESMNLESLTEDGEFDMCLLISSMLVEELGHVPTSDELAYGIYVWNIMPMLSDILPKLYKNPSERHAFESRLLTRT